MGMMAPGSGGRFCLLAAACVWTLLGPAAAQAACQRQFGQGCARCTAFKCTAVTDGGLYVLQDSKAVFQRGVEPGPDGNGRPCRPGFRKAYPGNFACESCGAVSARSYTPFFRSRKCRYCEAGFALNADRTTCTPPDCKRLFGAGCGRCTFETCTAVNDDSLYVIQDGKAIFQRGVEPGPSGRGRACRPGFRKVEPGNYACESCGAASARGYTPLFRSDKCLYCPQGSNLSAGRTSCTAPSTRAPTARPTAAPTATPTAAPTTAPSKAPTATPTVQPTASPTTAPTATPTAEPTATPTAEPTAEPAAEPTATPTAEPTAEPTVEPTAQPTAQPTAAPTGCPADRPTGFVGCSGQCTCTTQFDFCSGGTCIVCFAADSEVMVRDAATGAAVLRQLADVLVGDQLQAVNEDGNLGWTTVYNSPHGSKHAPMLRISTASGAALTMTANHFLYIATRHSPLSAVAASQFATRGAVTAANVRVGDDVWVADKTGTVLSSVTAIEHVSPRATITLHTLRGNMVVDGVAASDHALSVFGGLKPQEPLMRGVFAPWRLAWAVSPTAVRAISRFGPMWRINAALTAANRKAAAAVSSPNALHAAAGKAAFWLLNRAPAALERLLVPDPSFPAGPLATATALFQNGTCETGAVEDTADGGQCSAADVPLQPACSSAAAAAVVLSA